MWNVKQIACVLLIVLTGRYSAGAIEIHGVAYERQTTTGAPGVFVTLFFNAKQVAQKSTAADGQYRFAVSAAGSYKITYRKVAHDIIVPESSIEVADDDTSLPPINVFPRDERLSIGGVFSVLKARLASSTDPKLMERDLLTLEKSGLISIASASTPRTTSDILADWERTIHPVIGDDKRIRFVPDRSAPLVILDAKKNATDEPQDPFRFGMRIDYGKGYVASLINQDSTPLPPEDFLLREFGANEPSDSEQRLVALKRLRETIDKEIEKLETPDFKVEFNMRKPTPNDGKAVASPAPALDGRKAATPAPALK